MTPIMPRPAAEASTPHQYHPVTMERPTADLTALAATRLVELVTRREVSAREVVTAFLDRIETHDGSLGAFVHLEPERLVADAAAADAAASHGSVGPLHGLPIGVKDIIDVAGMPTSGGSALPAVHPATDSDLVARLRAAGAILAGKLTTSELGCGSPYVLRQPRNPWDRRHVAGGSSAGSAIAVASRMLPAAIGGDTGGSIRIPASFCGIVGLRPTVGAVSLGGVIPLAPGIDSAGPMTRTVGDACLLLRVLAPDLPTADAEPPTAIACPEPIEPDVDPEVAAAVTAAGRHAAEELGLPRRAFASGPLMDAWAGAWVAIYRKALEVHADLLRQHLRELSLPFQWKLCAAAALSSRDVTAGRRIVTHAVDALSDLVRDGALVVLPTTSHPANAVDRPYGGRDTMAWTAGPSIAGLPAISVPAGRTRAGLPIGLQIVAASEMDLPLLRLAERLESAGVIGDPGSPMLPSSSPDDPAGPTPREAPAATAASPAEIAEVRAAARRLGIGGLEEKVADGAARSLRAVRMALHGTPRR